MSKNTNKNTSKRKLIAIVAGAMATITAAVGSIAHFTDRVQDDATFNVGNVGIELVNLDNTMTDVIAPGCIIPLSYTVNNTGTLAVDEREKVALSVFKADGTTPINLSATPSEFEIYKREDVEEVTGKGYAPKAGKSPIGNRVNDDGFTVTADGNRIIYMVPQQAIDGSDNELGDSVTDTLSRDFVILFRGTSSNEFMNCQVKIDVLAEAKQHAYTSAYDNDWTELQSKSVTFNTGTQAVVPAKTEFTSNPAPNATP